MELIYTLNFDNISQRNGALYNEHEYYTNATIKTKCNSIDYPILCIEKTTQKKQNINQRNNGRCVPSLTFNIIPSPRQ